MNDNNNKKTAPAAHSNEQKPARPNKLSVGVRILIGIVALPSFLLFCMLIASVVAGDTASIGFFEMIYAMVGVFALYIALTGKRIFL